MFGDMKAMLEQARQMQTKLQSMQEELAQRQVEGQAGDGAVRITLNGRGELLSVKIAPNVAPNVTSDATLLEDLVAIAFRDAHAKVQALVQSEMGGLGGSIAGLLPGL